MAGTFALFPPIPEPGPAPGLDWAALVPHVPRARGDEATRLRRRLADRCAAVVTARDAAAAAAAAECAAVAEQYLALVEAMCAAVAGDASGRPQLGNGSMLVVHWRVAMFGGTGDVADATLEGCSVVYSDASLLFERVCTMLVLVACLQRQGSCRGDCDGGDALYSRGAALLARLRGDVLPLFRGCAAVEGRFPHVLSPDFCGALQCALTGQAFVARARVLMRAKLNDADNEDDYAGGGGGGGEAERQRQAREQAKKLQSARLLLRASGLFDRAGAVLPAAAALDEARARAKAFAYGALADVIVTETGECGVAEALMREAVGAVTARPRSAALHALFSRRLRTLAEQNRLVFGCMSVPEARELRVENAVAGGGGGISVTRDERGVAWVRV